MSTTEALTVTLLGMSVVFFGLVLCVAFIHLSHRVARRIPWTDHTPVGEPIASPAPIPAPAPTAVVPEPPSPAVLAVIATVLEMEQRLYQGRPTSRLTIRRPGAGA